MPLREQEEGELVGGVEAALQAAREEEERRAGEAAEEVRHLDDRQRDEVLQPGEPRVDSGRGAGEERGGRRR